MSDERHDKHETPAERTPHTDAPHAKASDPEAYVHEMEDLERRSSSAARLFDVRRIIGGLFVVYGVIVTIAGISPSEAALEKAEGIHINLWTGLAMLALGIFFLAWLRLSPAVPPPTAEETEAPNDGPRAG